MKVVKVISKSRNGRQMEVIGEDEEYYGTLHIHRQSKRWTYFKGLNDHNEPIFRAIEV